MMGRLTHSPLAEQKVMRERGTFHFVPINRRKIAGEAYDGQPLTAPNTSSLSIINTGEMYHVTHDNGNDRCFQRDKFVVMLMQFN